MTGKSEYVLLSDWKKVTLPELWKSNSHLMALKHRGNFTPVFYNTKFSLPVPACELLPLHPPHPGVQVWQGLDKVHVRCCHPLSLSFSCSTSVNYFTKVIYSTEQFHRVEPFANYIFYFPCICSPSLLYVKWPLAWERSNCFLSGAPINEGLLPCTLD